MPPIQQRLRHESLTQTRRNNPSAVGTSRDSKPMKELSRILTDIYGEPISAITLEKYYQQGFIEAPALPAELITAQAAYLVKKLKRTGPGGSDEILSVLFAIGYPVPTTEIRLREDLGKLVSHTLERRQGSIELSGREEAEEIANIVQRLTANPKTKEQRQVSALIRDASTAAGDDKARKTQTVFQIWKSTVYLRSGDESAIATLVSEFARLFAPEMSDAEMTRIASRFNLLDMLRTVERIPLPILYTRIEAEFYEGRRFGREHAMEWLTGGVEAIKSAVFNAIARYTVEESALPPVVDAEASASGEGEPL